MHLTHDGRFSPDNKAWAKEIEPYAKYENRDLIVSSHPAVLNGFINQTRRYMEQEKEIAAQQITIDGQLCLKIDEWKSEENNYVLGNSMQDNAFFYVLINENVHFEYDYKPSREEIENDYLNLIAMEDIDRHEAEVFSRIEGTEDVAETESRFSVEETSDAFEPGQDFAVWDHGREDYYIKEDGTIPTFETKEEAEHYLQSMEPDTSGHDVQRCR